MMSVNILRFDTNHLSGLVQLLFYEICIRFVILRRRRGKAKRPEVPPTRRGKQGLGSDPSIDGDSQRSAYLLHATAKGTQQNWKGKSTHSNNYFGPLTINFGSWFPSTIASSENQTSLYSTSPPLPMGSAQGIRHRHPFGAFGRGLFGLAP